MINVGKDGVFGDDVVDLAEFDDVRLLEPLHGVVLARPAVPG